MAKRQLGRKVRQPSMKEGRYQVNVLLSEKTKNMLLEASAASGRAMSAEAAIQIENGITFNKLFRMLLTSREAGAAGATSATNLSGYRGRTGTPWPTR